MVLLPKIFTYVILEKNFSKKTNYKPHIKYNILPLCLSVPLSLFHSHTHLNIVSPAKSFPTDFRFRRGLHPSSLPPHSWPKLLSTATWTHTWQGREAELAERKLLI